MHDGFEVYVGFWVGLLQLAIFENMGNKVNRDSPFYKKWKVAVLGKVPVSSFCD
jgi:hypothetical protein